MTISRKTKHSRTKYCTNTPRANRRSGDCSNPSTVPNACRCTTTKNVSLLSYAPIIIYYANRATVLIFTIIKRRLVKHLFFALTLIVESVWAPALQQLTKAFNFFWGFTTRYSTSRNRWFRKRENVAIRRSMRLKLSFRYRRI